jgi:hypothetical protein
MPLILFPLSVAAFPLGFDFADFEMGHCRPLLSAVSATFSNDPEFDPKRVVSIPLGCSGLIC